MTPRSGRPLIRELPAETARARLVADVADCLARQPRRLPTEYLYDPLGSALFDAICRLPWYQVTRAETSLLARHGRDILWALEPLTDIIELGPGSGAKLATLLGTSGHRILPLHVHLIDVSRAALDMAAGTIGTHPSLKIVAHQASYEAGLRDLRLARPGRGRALVLFLGSNIGNFSPAEGEAFIATVRSTLVPGDGFAMGVDLVKPEHDLLLAYDDPLGVTAAFNRNLLIRLNRELGASFDVEGYRHRAIWNAEASRVEMHLVSIRRQRVRIPAASVDIDIQEGETLWTESSYKYRGDQVVEMLERQGFTKCRQWTDGEAQFALTLAHL